MPSSARPRANRAKTRRSSSPIQSKTRQNPSAEAIKAGEQFAMAAFASGLKLAAAFGTVAAKTAGLAFASLASGADKFSELVKEEALRSHGTQTNGRDDLRAKENLKNKGKTRRNKTRRQKLLA